MILYSGDGVAKQTWLIPMSGQGRLFPSPRVFQGRHLHREGHPSSLIWVLPLFTGARGAGGGGTELSDQKEADTRRFTDGGTDLSKSVASPPSGRGQAAVLGECTWMTDLTLPRLGCPQHLSGANIGGVFIASVGESFRRGV